MEAMNKRLENLTWPDEDKTREQLEAIRELAKELHADYPTDTADEPTNWSNEARNRRNAYIRAQFLKDENGVTLHLLNGSEWLELFDLLGFSVDKETRKRFASHLKWYSFWYADFKPRLSSKYAQRIHWYVHNFLFCLRNKLQTEKEYREGKYGSKGQAYFMGIEQQPATPAETPRISKETAETVNVSAEEEKAAERAENKPYYTHRWRVLHNCDLKTWDKFHKKHKEAILIFHHETTYTALQKEAVKVSEMCDIAYEVNRHGVEVCLFNDVTLTQIIEQGIYVAIAELPKVPDYGLTDAPQSPEAPQTVDCATDTPKPRETARKPQNRGIGSTRHSRLGANGYTMLDNASATLTAMSVPRECSTADYW